MSFKNFKLCMCLFWVESVPIVLHKNGVGATLSDSLLFLFGTLMGWEVCRVGDVS